VLVGAKLHSQVGWDKPEFEHYFSCPLDACGTSRLLQNSALQAAQKDLRGEAREESASGGVLCQYVGAGD
jgi:hypothetical protein